MTESLRDGLARAICCPHGCEAIGAPYDPCLGRVSVCHAASYTAAADAALAYIAAQGYLRESEEAKHNLIFREAVAIAKATGHVMTRTTEDGVEIIYDIWKGKDEE